MVEVIPNYHLRASGIQKQHLDKKYQQRKNWNKIQRCCQRFHFSPSVHSKNFQDNNKYTKSKKGDNTVRDTEQMLPAGQWYTEPTSQKKLQYRKKLEQQEEVSPKFYFFTSCINHKLPGQQKYHRRGKGKNTGKSADKLNFR